MFFNSNDYPKGREYRVRKVREAERERLAQAARVASPSRFRVSSVHLERRWVVIALLAALVVLTAAVAQWVHANEVVNIPTRGEGEFFAAAMTHYRLGEYFFYKGDYRRAVDEYTLAVNGIAAVVFERSAIYATMYWSLADAQLMAGAYREALASYRHFLELAGDAASDQAISFVQHFEVSLLTDRADDVRPLSG